ncbi:MAG: glycyl-radical enzyme activating protein [Verrucomicrobia bacterium]|jgi:pyruvate formate lyase activating enzyme|nr:glycyl-radical enzyme activating protein [Verrucomicrobiota bacterium]MBT7068990.1 glycyl-radical enzyme activating protein [Verrucomicrobiota bacterium]MBT7700965.1 glycyl-radical enzyme activating protein [Verrucomicrobiota bacterium]
MKGVIFDIKRFAVHDGPGIRTTVFLKGCPLRCSWCHNPESQGFGVATLEGRTGAIEVGRSVSVADVVDTVERDTSFFDESGGGVTFSGGEPLAQPDFLMALLERCGALDIHRAVDTCGEARGDTLLSVAAQTDLFLFDLKLSDSVRHREFTGVGIERIRDNLMALCATEVPIELRVPVVPGINDSAEEIAALAAFVAGLPRALPLHLLAYHSAAMDKYPRFGMPPPLPDTPEPVADDLTSMRRRLEAAGVEVRQ